MAKTAKADLKSEPLPVKAESVYFLAADGLKLHAKDYNRGAPGTDAHLPVVCLPGLTRNHRDFHDFAMIAAGNPKAPRRIVSFDYRGRGLSERDSNAENYNVLKEADDVLSGMAALGLGHAIFLGTSRGGLIMHAFSAMRPGMMAAGVLNDIGPVIEGAGLAQIKAYLTRMSLPRDWQDAARVLADAHGRSFPVLSPEDWADFARAIYVEKNGKLEADYDTGLLNALKGIDLNTPLPTLWPQFEGLATMPLMTIRGEHSTLLSEATVAEMKSRAPGMEAVTVAGQGHAPILHLGDLPKTLLAFFAKADKARH